MNILLYVALIGLGVIIFGVILSAALVIADARQAKRPKPVRYRYITIDEHDIYRIAIYTAAAGTGQTNEDNN